MMPKWLPVLLTSHYDPKIIEPFENKTIESASVSVIKWNPFYRESNGWYYNNHTRLSIVLYNNRRRVVANITQDYPFMFGEYPWNTSGIPLGRYQLQIYPSYFDWDCLGCKYPLLSPPFDIVACNACTVVPVDLKAALPFITLVVGLFALFSFLVAFCFYTRTGKKAWVSWSCRKRGLAYSSQGAGEDEESLRAQEKEKGGKQRVDVFPQPNSLGPPAPLMTRAGLDRPSALFTQEKSVLACSLPPSSYLPSDVEYLDTATLDSVSDECVYVDEISSLPSPVLSARDAILVGETFRNALRVAHADHRDRELSSICGSPLLEGKLNY